MGFWPRMGCSNRGGGEAALKSSQAWSLKGSSLGAEPRSGEGRQRGSLQKQGKQGQQGNEPEAGGRWTEDTD